MGGFVNALYLYGICDLIWFEKGEVVIFQRFLRLAFNAKILQDISPINNVEQLYVCLFFSNRCINIRIE